MIRYPSLSIIIPTLNAGYILKKCLESIDNQNYPKNKIEIIIADGGSTDETLCLAKKYNAIIIHNQLKTGEAGKACGVKIAKNEILALIDSDNILPDTNWLKRMTKPFEDINICLSEPIAYTYRHKDPILTRYFALLGMNDPICLFLGNYDRHSYLTGKWTNLKFPEENFSDYLKIKLDHEPLPTIGANGTMIRRQLFEYFSEDYLFDIDLIVDLLRKNKFIFVAKVKTGIVHTFVEDDMFKFFRKQLRRINDLAYFSKNKSRSTDWEKNYLPKILMFVFQGIIVFPILFQTIKGFSKKPDIAWFFHPIACYSTLYIYLYGWIKGKINPTLHDRQHWRQ
jgi:glycosyltransferase involved in cell wall biosynthesis